MILLSATVTKLHDNVVLDDHFQQKLILRRRCLANWNHGVSLFYDSEYTTACEMGLHTDTSLAGFAGIFQNQWFCLE